jgi:hypothetical protein
VLRPKKSVGLSAAWPQINRHLSTHPAQANAVVLFRLAQCPERIFQQGWQTLDIFQSAPWFFKRPCTDADFPSRLG